MLLRVIEIGLLVLHDLLYLFMLLHEGVVQESLRMIIEEVNILPDGCTDPVDEITRMCLEVCEHDLIDLLVQNYDLGNLHLNIIKFINIGDWKRVDPSCDTILSLHD